MKDATIIFAFVIAGIVICCQLAYAVGEYCPSYIDNLSAIADVGIFIATLFATLYAVVQYHYHKKEHRINLLGEYNKRYATDKNIQEVITWMLKVAIVNDDGEIVNAEPYRCYCKPSIHEKEMFMRFFEELYLHIENGSMDKRQVCKLFSYYAIKFDEIKEFRLDITDYKSKEELENEEKDKEEEGIAYTKKYWTNYRKFVNEMKIEWQEINK